MSDPAPSAQSAAAPTLAEVARAAEHFRYCSNAGETTEFRCSLCVAASNVVAAALAAPSAAPREPSYEWMQQMLDRYADNEYKLNKEIEQLRAAAAPPALSTEPFVCPTHRENPCPCVRAAAPSQGQPAEGDDLDRIAEDAGVRRMPAAPQPERVGISNPYKDYLISRASASEGDAEP